MRRPIDARESCRGNATIVALLALLAIAGVAGTVLSASHRNSGETSAAAALNQAFLAAEFGASAALAELGAAPGADEDPGRMGTAAEPIELAGSSYWTEFETLDGDFRRLRSHGRAGPYTRTLEVVFLVDRPASDGHSRPVRPGATAGRGLEVLSWREVGSDRAVPRGVLLGSAARQPLETSGGADPRRRLPGGGSRASISSD